MESKTPAWVSLDHTEAAGCRCGLCRTKDTGVSPCFVNCGEPACQKLGCVRVYNSRHKDLTSQ